MFTAVVLLLELDPVGDLSMEGVTPNSNKLAALVSSGVCGGVSKAAGVCSFLSAKVEKN